MAEKSRRSSHVSAINFSARSPCSGRDRPSLTLDETELTRLRARLLDEIKADQDSSRLYRLVGKFDEIVERYGCDRRIDFDGPLIA